MKIPYVIKIIFSIFILFSSQIIVAMDNNVYKKEIETWRNERVARLIKPDGWLSLIGLHWLKEGKNRIGSAANNDIIIEKLPKHVGIITLKDNSAIISYDKNLPASLFNGSGDLPVAMSINGNAKDPWSSPLLPDSADHPTVVKSGTVSFYLIQRGNKSGLRVKDSAAETLKNFVGLDYFDIDPEWRIEARWEAFNPPHEIEIPTIIGTVEKYPIPGVAIFEREGREFRLIPYLENPEDKQLFLVFADRTSGKETYGAARFLYTDMPKDGKIVLDFNKAYNPPCAFTSYATCPLAPPENRLDLRVTAGEKKYRGSAH